ncbi:Cyclin-dependent kinase 2-interacting protein [Oopsacas minuta]|uniref:Cyclin-dependent kinase 2-interacting protein n=1 Tax=Oopsacas minuta TaxID=111878 RepID=A0AAV7JVB4_9METZ|nr:Cyclin-dependent kinase 2-interacting protein [Oopsacas minuta]
MERKLKDSWAKWHNLVFKWDELNKDTFNQLQKLLNNRTQIDYYLAPSLDILNSVSELKETVISQLYIEQCQLKSALNRTRGKFLKLAGDMETLTQELTSCEELIISESNEWLQYSPHPNFPSFTLSHFRLFSERLLFLYRKELHIKLILLKELPIAKTEDSKVLYLTTWSFEPFLDKELTFSLNLILSILDIK